MKLKNSYILLIAMALFLLISIGSVCASENITNDNDVKLADHGSDKILKSTNDNDERLSDDSNEETQKINTTVNADNTKVRYNEDKNISIKVLDNESNSIDVNKSNITVFEGNNQLNFLYNNSIITITDSLSVGNHSIIINYLGNSKYANSSTTVILSITGNNTINTPESVVSDGQTIIVPITVFNGVENVNINNDDLTLNITYIDENGNITSKKVTNFAYSNGNISITVDSSFRLVSASLTINCTNATSSKKVLIKLATYIEASEDKKVRTNETKNITVTVKFDGNTLNITKNDLKVFKNGTEISFNYVNSTITFTETNVGVYNITIVYNGNETYNSSSKSVIFKIFGDLTINPPASANVDKNKNVTITLNLSDGADLCDIDKSKLKLILSSVLNNQTTNRTIDIFTVNGQNITFNVNEEFDSAKVIITYQTNTTNLTKNVTIKIDTTIDCDDEFEFGDNETIKIPVNVNASNGKQINITQDNIKIFNGQTELNITLNNSVITIHNKLTYGNYNLTIKFIGNDTYSDALKVIVLKIYGINMNTTTTTINSTKKGEIIINSIGDGVNNYTFTVNDLNITVSYLDGNVTKNITVTNIELIENKTIKFILENGDFKQATLTIAYRNSTATVTLNRVYNTKVEIINNEAEYQSGNFTYKLIDIDSNEAISNKTVKLTYSVSSQSITFQQTIESKTDENGVVIFDNSKIFVSYFNLVLPIGPNKVTLSGDNLNLNSSSQNVTIVKATININIDKFVEYYGTDKKVKITVTNAKTGTPVKFTTIHLFMESSSQKDYYFSTDENGTSEISVSGLVGGDYPITVNNNDTENMNPKTVDGIITILKIPVTAEAKDVTVSFNTGTTETIKITKDGKALEGVYVLVRLYTTSSRYSDYLFQTDKNGLVRFSASLGVGKHKMVVSSADARYDFKSFSRTITVKKATGKIKAPKVKAYYNDGKYFTIKLTNKKNKKPIYDAKLNIKIFISKTRYYNYNGNTGTNGKLKLLINLKPGSYKVVIGPGENKNFTAKNVTSKIVVKKAPTVLKAKKVVAKKGSKKYLKVTAKNKKTKHVLPKIKLKAKVYTGKKSKTYTIKTDAKGVAKLSTTSLKKGNHKVVIVSANKYCKAKAEKSSIKIK